MKLLVVTQAMDRQDPVLGFFHAWVEALAERCEAVEVICLRKGDCALPDNVTVHSLGKEGGARSRAAYAWTFLRLVWQLRRRYDAAFVHMNQEYLLLAGPLWAALGKRAYLWRNHYAGSFLTDLAAFWCTKVFCTSKHSYTARYKRTILMPVGVDLSRFAGVSDEGRDPRSILFLARMAPSKRPELVLEALMLLAAKGGLPFTATFAGSPEPVDQAFYDDLQAKAREFELDGAMRFVPGVPHDETPALYGAHELFVNASRSGMFDKTLFEAAASGCLVVAASDDFKDAAGKRFHFTDAASLAERLEDLLALTEDERVRLAAAQKALARAESLGTLADRLAQEMEA